MKLKQILLASCLMLFLFSGFSQDRSAYRDARDYFCWRVVCKGYPAFVYDRKTYKLAINDDFIIPVLLVTFRYEQFVNPESHLTEETVLWECKEKDCIFEKEHLQNTSSCRAVFHEKKECIEFIKLFSEFRFAVELIQKAEK